MPRTNAWSQSVPRVELDQRSREARLRLEQGIERLLLPRDIVKESWPRRALYFFDAGTYRGAARASS